MTFNKNDIDTIEKAREYLNYHGGKLTDQEKEIFDSSLLTPNGTLDVSLLQDTAELLNDCKKAETNLKIEQSADVLSNDGNKLLVSLMAERRNNSIAYQLVNEKDENEEGRVDKMKKYNEQILQEQTELEKKISTIVQKLKDDLAPGGTGRKFLDCMLEIGKINSDLQYRADIPETVDRYASVIQTGYNGNSKPFTHPLYLESDLPDKDKLYSYIGSSTCTHLTADQKKEFKDAFNRFVERKDITFSNGGLQNRMVEEVKKEIFRISDVFCIMHALFPKDSDYKDSPFLKIGQKSCLQFSDTEKIYNKDDAINFSAYCEVLDEKGVDLEKICKISVYEDKLVKSAGSKHVAIMLHSNNYQKHVRDLIKNSRDAHGNPIFDEKEIDKFQKE
ncbi:1058_t:CDS:2 [Entrophospora sp. SA101]|nr:1058_t:CDS:2 [Entrophospora sp. SA101]CAJ0880108.1 2422_t:CDS:2 [Entrophospora sp. SA101]